VFNSPALPQCRTAGANEKKACRQQKQSSFDVSHLQNTSLIKNKSM
jgi:hypothetical protein